MGQLTDEEDYPVKIMVVGDQGTGKTGALASLIAAGFKIRMLDGDKGAKTLRNLILDGRNPYRGWMEKHGIPLEGALSYIPVGNPMGIKTVQKKVGDKVQQERVLAPKSAAAWDRAMSALDKWKDGDTEFGSIYDWDRDTICVIDSLSTMAKFAYYSAQALNGRLGARDVGYDYQRDVGEAQNMCARLMEMLSDDAVNCHVIVITHIQWVDQTKGVAGAPPRGGNDQGNNDNEFREPPKGMPMVIGRSFSPIVGKFFNDQYTVKIVSGSKRVISTIPADNIQTKNSVIVDKQYDITTGMAEIFAAHGAVELPDGFKAALSKTAR